MSLSNKGYIHPRAPKPEVLRIMNEIQGEIYWSATDKRWQNLLTARNEYIRNLLHIERYSTKQFKELDIGNKRYITRKIEKAFSSDGGGFYQYSRDSSWMQDAVGQHDKWIKIDGMACWHTRVALSALETKCERSATPPYSSTQHPPELGSSSQAPPFDPVRESASNNQYMSGN